MAQAGATDGEPVRRRAPMFRIGISGWTYKGWRGVFYPKGLAQRRELEYSSRAFNSIEINGSFYALQRPESYQRWYEQTPADFVFSVKGSRFITHMKKLGDPEAGLANFFASGLLRLKEKLGPLLWQLPPNLGFHPERMERFFAALPRDTIAAAELARRHDERLVGRSWTEAEVELPLRHCLEVRHPSFLVPECFELLRRHQVAFVFADTAGKWPYAEDLTSDFVYIRLHGDEQLYVSGYSDSALDWWAARIGQWSAGQQPSDACLIVPPQKKTTPHDIYVHFDNDAKVHAPFDAGSLAKQLTRAVS